MVGRCLHEGSHHDGGFVAFQNSCRIFWVPFDMDGSEHVNGSAHRSGPPTSQDSSQYFLAGTWMWLPFVSRTIVVVVIS